VEETGDAGLDEVVGAPSINQDNHVMIGDGAIETKCLWSRGLSLQRRGN